MTEDGAHCRFMHVEQNVRRSCDGFALCELRIARQLPHALRRGKNNGRKIDRRSYMKATFQCFTASTIQRKSSVKVVNLFLLKSISQMSFIALRILIYTAEGNITLQVMLTELDYVSVFSRAYTGILNEFLVFVQTLMTIKINTRHTIMTL